MDRAWWDAYGDEAEEVFAGERVAPIQVRQARRVRLVQTANSGAGAIALALHLGASSVVLLGYDSQVRAGRAHWHADHPAGLGNAGSVAKWPGQFRQLAAQLGGMEVVNCSRETALEMFPRGDLVEALGDRMKPPLIVDGMLGLGDNLHQRALVRRLMARHDVWLKTPWPSVYADLQAEGLRLVPVETKLRTQAKNAKREVARYDGVPPADVPRRRVWYSPQTVRARGGFLRAQCDADDVGPSDFALPVPQAWIDRARAWLGPVDRPVMLYRPLVERGEWSGCAIRNPDVQTYARLARLAGERFHVVSVADCEPRKEWIVSPDVPAARVAHAGELPFEVLAGLAALAGLVFCSPGFMLVLAQAVGARLCAVFGGHESARLYDHGDARHLFIEPARPCECFDKSHKCDKTIDIDRAEARLRSFLDVHHPQPGVGHDLAETV